MTKREDIPVVDARLKAAVSAALTERAAEARRSVKRTVVTAARSDGRWRPYRLLSQRAAAAFAALALVAGGASVAVASAPPGSPAYALKRAAERMALEAVPAGALEDALRARFAERRAAEIRDLLRSGLDEEALRRALESMGVAPPSVSQDGEQSAFDVLRRELQRMEGGSTYEPAPGQDAGQGPGGSSSPAGSGSGAGAPAGGGTSGGGSVQDGSSEATDQGSYQGGSGSGRDSQEATPDADSGSGESPSSPSGGSGGSAQGGSTDATGGPQHVRR
ncbi:hypothetical protein MX659_02540 [Coriobacteriia bacterium Es71-Z0120]|uniref:hypothetical protein n=1 Tax=Parvivirga hydrogeniphila TaxID=2939460 RepID=UPI002260ECA9|nr:hypothetical protein [Parvivirga hydrogeniphila]MCL4078483.1 hypothetical protein [Parvivirga hydrogeniphila]